jgi:hypothetical protein
VKTPKTFAGEIPSSFATWTMPSLSTQPNSRSRSRSAGSSAASRFG